jgi:hypothetical protein
MVIGPDSGPQPDPGVTTVPIQGLTSYQLGAPTNANYIVAAHNAKLWAWVEGTPGHWVHIGLGGTADGEDIFIARTGAINYHAVGPPPLTTYPIGTTEIEVDGLPAVTAPLLAPGEKLYFTTNLRKDYYEYTIKSFNPTGGTVTAGGPLIILEEPGLVFEVKDNWTFTVLRPAKVANPTPGNRYAGGAGSGAAGITISGYTGEVFNGEKFVIKSENITHTITSHTGTAPTTVIKFDPASIPGGPNLQGDWTADDANVRVVFAQGNDSLFFTDGTGFIYAWTGGIPTSPTVGGGTLMKIGSHSILDDFNGSFHSARTEPPQDVKVLLWFQNRLIASGIASEPDAIYFSDFFDGTSWDRDYQKVRIGGGESDPITGLLAWTDLNMICFKKNSCYLINLDPQQNPDPNDPTLLVASFAVKQLHKLIGCPAPWTATQVGGGSTTPGSDVFFVDGDKKVHSIRRVMAAETQQEVGQAMSLPIQDVLDSINIDFIDLACAMYHNEHYILALPSVRGQDGGQRNNAVVAYNLLTQSWCGVWSWAPTCFARRTDLGSYSKLIFGDYRVFPAGGGRVLQWMDDLSLEEETESTYQELVNNAGDGQPITTTILTRAFTGGDMYSFKTGLNVEFEFDESVAERVLIKVILDKVTVRDPTTGSDLIAEPFDTLSERRLRLGVPADTTLPFRLPASPSLLRKAFDLQRYGTWRELQFQITTNNDPDNGVLGGKLAIRSIRITYFSDTMRLHTIPNTGVLEGPVDLPTLPG